MSETFPGLPEAPPPAEPRVAAAVILWREGPEGREIFWVRRAEPLQFAGGFHAFPGGRLDEADRRLSVAGLPVEQAALVACACRELFEEAGVLLARGAERLSRGAREASRRALLDDRLDFAAFLEEHGLRLDPTVLAPAGRWITPPFAPLRYDAHVFLARMPEGEEAVVWPGELAGGEFIPASRALSLWERGEALLHPPNLWGVTCLARAEPSKALEMLRAPPHCDGFITWRVEFQKGIWMLPLRTPTLPPATHTNAYLVDLGGSLALVDPGSPWPKEQARLEEVLAMLAAEKLAVREIWLTHHHEDHVGGLAPLVARGLPIRAHPLTASQVLTGAAPFLPLADGDLLHGRFRVLHTPGHARGHVCLLDERTGALLCGDMVSTMSTIVIDPPEGDMAEYIRQLERLRALAPRTLYPAHGMPAPRAVGKLAEYIQHRREREEKIAAALAPGGTLSEITRAAYADTPPTFWPLAERSCLATLLKLRSEGRARDQDGRWTP
jgi:ribonuclease/clavin/mitogillin